MYQTLCQVLGTHIQPSTLTLKGSWVCKSLHCSVIRGTFLWKQLGSQFGPQAQEKRWKLTRVCPLSCEASGCRERGVPAFFHASRNSKSPGHEGHSRVLGLSLE